MRSPLRALVCLALAACAAPDEVAVFDDEEIGDSLPIDGKSDTIGISVPSSLRLDKDKIVYLTFDDGPSRANTPKILDVLAAHDVKATFFVTGLSIAGNEALIRRQRDEGHVIGSHQWSHVIASQAQFRGFVKKERDKLREIVGDDHALLFRFPYGAGATWKNTILREEGYLDGGIGWDVDSLDWDYGPDERATRAPAAYRADFEGWVMSQLDRRGGGVVLLHDVQSVTAKHLDSMIKKMKAAGYTFAALPTQRNWIGDECAEDEDCAFSGAFCLGGLCTQGCTGSCPDAWGRPMTRCARVADDEDAQVQVCTSDCTVAECRAGSCIDARSPTGAAREVCWGL